MKSLIRVSRVYDLPYFSAPSDGVHCHIDLRVHPSEIDSIPELRGQPRLKELVAIMNRPRGPFMTHGCAIARRPPYEPGGAIPLSKESCTAARWCTSYLTFSFWYLSRNKRENYEDIYESFTDEMNGTEVCFVIQPAYFLSRFEQRVGKKWCDTNATVCLIWASGWGDTDVVSHSRWRNSIKNLVDFFGDTNRFPDNASTSEVTVSQHILIDQFVNPVVKSSNR